MIQHDPEIMPVWRSPRFESNIKTDGPPNGLHEKTMILLRFKFEFIFDIYFQFSMCIHYESQENDYKNEDKLETVFELKNSPSYSNRLVESLMVLIYL